MPDPVNQARAEQSVALMLKYAQQLLADWVGDPERRRTMANRDV